MGQGSGNDGSRGSSGLFFRKARLKGFQDSILDTCRTLEGLGDDDDDERTPVEMERLESYYRPQQPDVVAEQGHIGGLRDITGGRAAAAGEGGGGGVFDDDYSPREVDEHQSDVELDSQGVSVLDEVPDSPEALPPRPDTVVSMSQLSLDSLYMGRSSESVRHFSVR